MIRNSTIMETQTIYPTAFQSNKIELENTSSKINLGEVFAVRKGSYLNEFNLFIAHFNSIPNFIHEINIDCKKANRWFANNYKSEIKDFYFNKRYYNGSKCAEYDHLFYILFDDLIVDFDINNSVVRFLYRKTEFLKVETVINAIKKFKERKKKGKPEISLLVND